MPTPNPIMFNADSTITAALVYTLYIVENLV